VREKKVVIASNIGDAPLSIENDPVTKNDIRNTTTPATSHTTRLMRRMRANPTRSILGGQRSSSIERLASSNGVAVDIVTDDKNGTYRYKYIRKVQNSKIFHCDEVHDMSDKYPLIGM
jgi:deferrochelatase/peroxidase EfeB